MSIYYKYDDFILYHRTGRAVCRGRGIAACGRKNSAQSRQRGRLAEAPGELAMGSGDMVGEIEHRLESQSDQKGGRVGQEDS